ncbi:MAG: VOC family protein [Pseudomonadota bacterium]
MKVYGFRIFVSNLAEARSFYAHTLSLPISFETEDALGFDAGIQIIVELDDGAHPGLQGRFTGLSFSTENLGADYDALRARGVQFVAPPEEQPWGGSLAHFLDPSGNTLTLVSL